MRSILPKFRSLHDQNRIDQIKDRKEEKEGLILPYFQHNRQGNSTIEGVNIQDFVIPTKSN